MLKLENSIRGLSFSRVAFDLTIHDKKISPVLEIYRITLLSNGGTIKYLGVIVLEIYRITLLSNHSVLGTGHGFVLEIYRITLLSNSHLYSRN